MKLLIIFHSLDKLAGGVENRLSTLEKNLPNSIEREYLLFKNRVTLPCKGSVNIINSLYIPKIILEYKSSLKPIAFFFGFLIFIYRIYHTRKFIKKNSFSTILAVDDYFSLIAILSTFGINIKIISSVRNNWDKLYSGTMIHLLPDFIYKKILPKLFNKYVYKVHCVSQCLAKQLKENYGINNTVCIYNLFDSEKIKKLSLVPISFDFNYIINIGHLNPQKNQKDIIYAFALLKEEGFDEKLVLVGDGTEKKNLMRLADELKVSNDVIFTGKQKNPYKYLKHATLYVSSSLYEGLPAVLIESLILNVPIVSYDFQCGANELTDNTTKLSYNALAQKMKELLRSDILKEKSVNEGNKIFNDKFTRHKIINDWIELFE